MKTLYFICLFLFINSAFAWNNCKVDEDSGLWVKNYTCDEQSVQVGHELFNDSFSYKGKTNYAEVKDEPNKDFLKQHKELQDALD